MEMSMYNPLKARLETVEVDFTDKNTTWFDGCTDHHDIYMITDAGGGLLITEFGYSYPIWIAGESRATISYSKKRALELMRIYQ
jgi:hypothetical protein